MRVSGAVSNQAPVVELSLDHSTLTLRDITDFEDFRNMILSQDCDTKHDLQAVVDLLISGCEINDFSFLKEMPALKRIGFIACTSDRWSDLKELTNISSLRLHNLKQGKRYLASLDFLRELPSLEYLYLNMLGIGSLPDISDLTRLHTVFGTFRNENAVHDDFDYSAFEYLPALKIFDSGAAVDRHRIPAEGLIPVLKNPTVEAVCVSQMYSTEDKKLIRLMQELNPKLLEPFMSQGEMSSIDKRRRLIGSCFVW